MGGGPHPVLSSGHIHPSHGLERQDAAPFKLMHLNLPREYSNKYIPYGMSSSLDDCGTTPSFSILSLVSLNMTS